MPDRNERRDAGAAPRRPLRVLCAEDDRHLALLLQLGLQRAGHFAACVEDGQAALDRLQEDWGFFDLLITDHHMPRLSGPRLAAALRGSPFRGRVVVHSSQLRPEEVRAYRALAVDRLFAKPLETPALLQAVEVLARELAAAEASGR